MTCAYVLGVIFSGSFDRWDLLLLVPGERFPFSQVGGARRALRMTDRGLKS